MFGVLFIDKDYNLNRNAEYGSHSLCYLAEITDMFYCQRLLVGWADQCFCFPIFLPFTAPQGCY